MGSLIAVFGSPGSGKTTLSLALASKLALQKENVVLVSSDRVVPNLKVLLPTVETDRSKSMGPLLMQSDLTQKLIIDRMVFHPKNDCLAVMALAPGDNPISYPHLFDPPKVMGFLSILSGLADYVVVDCTSNPATDTVTLAALEAGSVICALTPDQRGLSYLTAMLTVLRDDKYRIENHLRVLSPVREIEPANEVRGRIEDVRFLLPYSPEVEEKMLAGALLSGFGRRAGLLFENRVEQILEVVR